MLCPVAYEARCPKCAPATPTQVPPAPAIAEANATSSADPAIGTTPVKAAEPAAVVAAISPVTTDSVNEDRFTASGETSNIDMIGLPCSDPQCSPAGFPDLSTYTRTVQYEKTRTVQYE